MLFSTDLPLFIVKGSNKHQIGSKKNICHVNQKPLLRRSADAFLV